VHPLALISVQHTAALVFGNTIALRLLLTTKETEQLHPTLHLLMQNVSLVMLQKTKPQ